jgi:hypothetical protein
MLSPIKRMLKNSMNLFFQLKPGRNAFQNKFLKLLRMACRTSSAAFLTHHYCIKVALKRLAISCMYVAFPVIGSTLLTACGGGGTQATAQSPATANSETQATAQSPATANNFQVTAKVAGISVGSLALASGQNLTIGMQAGQVLELDASSSPVSWSPVSSTVAPVVDSNTTSSWSATMPASANGQLVMNVVATQDPTKKATLTVHVVPPTKVSGDGSVGFFGRDPAATQIVSLQTTLTVPAQPPASGTLFLSPGLQPRGTNYLPIDNGVLQPALTWGPSCAPGNQPPDYSTWWVSAQYVNTFGGDPGYTGCKGGSIMPVRVGDQLQMTMSLNGTVWVQTVTDLQTGQSVNFSIDMQNQYQNIGRFVIEGYSQLPVGDVVFTDTVLTFSTSAPWSCIARERGINDSVSTPIISADGKQCSIAEIVLRSS